MRMKQITFLFLILYSLSGFGQKYDQHWLAGYNGSGTFPFTERLLISFNPNLTIDSIITPMQFISSSGAMSDANGQLLFFTNGGYIADRTGNLMLNGDNLNLSNCSTAYAPYGIPVPQCLVILPSPADSNFFYIFHTTCDLDSSPLGEPRKLMYSTIDMTLNGGLGGVVQKNIPIFHDVLSYGNMTSCKHANGRDWWIIVPQLLTNVYHRILLTSSGIISDTIQYGSTHPGQSHPARTVFSPNAEWYCRYDVNVGMSLMHFDRCDGTFSNELTKPASYFPNSLIQIGAEEFSPNSRFLYITSMLQVNQFDLNAADILNSQVTVALTDTFYCPFDVNLTWPTLAPDGKIYINSSSGNYCIGYIDQPDSPGVACNVIQHGLTFPIAIAGSSGFPNNPNYRLGTKDCTTNTIENKLKQLNLYPNPANTFFSINGIAAKDINQINVYSFDGKVIASFVNPTGNTFDVSNLKGGIYLANVITTLGIYNLTFEIIKK